MPGGTHDVCTKDSTMGKRLLNIIVRHALQAQTQRPFCSRKVLGLDSTHPLHESLRGFECSTGNVLVMKPLVRNVQVDHSSIAFLNLRASSYDSVRDSTCYHSIERVLPKSRGCKRRETPTVKRNETLLRRGT